MTKMPDQPLNPKLKWPRWNWRDSGWWLTAFGTMFAVVLFVLSSITHHSLWMRLAISLGCAVSSPVVILAVEHLIKTCSVAINRLRVYNRLYEDAEQKTQQMAWAQEAIRELSQELTNDRRFEIEKTLYYNQLLYIVLRKKRGARLEVGDRIRVIDNQNGGIMGVFEVNEVRLHEYRAQQADYVNPVWLGYVHQNGKAETSAPPNTIALLMPKDQNDD